MQKSFGNACGGYRTSALRKKRSRMTIRLLEKQPGAIDADDLAGSSYSIRLLEKQPGAIENAV